MKSVWLCMAVVLLSCATTQPKREFRVWTAPSLEATTKESHCIVTVYALATGLEPVRITAIDVDVIDLSHKQVVEVPTQHQLKLSYTFFDPTTLNELAHRGVSFRCFALFGGLIAPADLEGVY